MNADELRAAAERLRRVGDGEAVAQAYRAYPSPHMQRYGDIVMLADAWIAEHPADDGDPVDEAWVKGLGFEQYEYVPYTWLKCGHLQYVPSRDPPFCIVGGWPVIRVETRGHVRRIAAALGIELKEQP